jgi:hypothetical protein
MWIIGGGGVPEGKRPLGRRCRRWVYNIMVDHIEIGWGNADRLCGLVVRVLGYI